MNITEFARQRGVEPQTVRHYINEHAEIKKHTTKNGKSVELLAEAEKLLDQKYPLPKPIEIIEDKESRQKLIQAQELIVQLQQKQLELMERIADQSTAIAKAEAQTILLEDKERQLQERDKQIKELGQRLNEKEYELSEQRSELEEEKEQKLEAVQEVERLKNRGLWDRIMNK